MAWNPPGNDLSWNRGPLTTVFSPPSTCLATTTVYVLGYANPPPAQTSSYYVALWPPGLPDYLIDTTSNPCIPPGATPVPLQQVWYYSPGICPSSYTPALQLAVPEPSTTAWLCCPSGYVASPDASYAPFTTMIACASSASGGEATVTNLWSAPHGDSTSDTVWPVSVPTADVTPTAVLAKPTVWALGIPVMWQSTDSEVVSWFSSQGSGSAPQATTTPAATHATATSSPARPTTAASSTRVSTSKAAAPRGGHTVALCVMAAALVMTIFIL